MSIKKPTRTPAFLTPQTLARAAFPLALIVLGVWFAYPAQITPEQQHAYTNAYFTTLFLTLGGVVIGVVLGFFLAFVRFANNKIINFFIDEYIDIIRGTPILVQLMVFAFVVMVHQESFTAAVVALGLNSSSYVAEIVRSGIGSVERGQMEAARAMGLTYTQSMRLIILPQAFKNILPALANEFISLFKETSVVGMIGLFDLTMQSKSLQAALYTPQPILFAGVVYYANVKFFSLLVKVLEWRLNRND